MKIRAKLKLVSVNKRESAEDLTFQAVCSDQYGPNGENEDNTFARWTPSAEVKLTVVNPDLLGKFEPGKKYYVDFTPAE